MTIESPGAFWKDYELIDSGNFEKLERFGPFIMARPEPKALWDKSLSDGEWNKMIHTRFKTGAGFGKAGKEDSGTDTCVVSDFHLLVERNVEVNAYNRLLAGEIVSVNKLLHNCIECLLLFSCKTEQI